MYLMLEHVYHRYILDSKNTVAFKNLKAPIYIFINSQAQYIFNKLKLCLKMIIINMISSNV